MKDLAKGAVTVFLDMKIGRKFAATVALAIFSMTALSLIGASALQAAGKDNDSLLQADKAGRAVLQADMMHDAVRADVLRSLEVDRASYQATLKELADHSSTLKSSLAEVRQSNLNSKVSAAVTAVTPSVDGYLLSARQISRQAGENATAARAAYPKFEIAFKQLEVQLPRVGATVTEHAAAVAAGTTSRRASALRLLAGTGLCISLVFIVFGWLVSRSIAGPMQRTVKVLEGLAEGRLDGHLDMDTKDEVGQMAKALNAAMTKLRETMSAMGNNAQGLASSSEELSAVSSQMTGSAEESATQANLVSAAAEQVSRNVQTVATGTEEMSASIREIAKNAHDAAGVAEQAVHVAETTSATVAKLGQSSAEIGTVIKVINSIAEQTNLLALNATIEAARAGEAGKGFAVVANEVKELAQETSKATEDIGARIEAIQSDTAAAVAAISEISAIIAQINDTQSTIASAVEEQTATTNEMGRNVTEAATGSSDIAENITGVARSASDTTAAASSTSQAADELARMASDLQQLVGQFAY
jgi:methyl-accepting chemotaxis protein